MKVVISEDRYVSSSISSLNLTRLRCFLIRVFYPFADVVFSPTRITRNDLIKNYGLPRKKVKVIRNWTTFVEKKSCEVKKEYDLIFIGRLHKEKNLLYLLRGLKRLKEKKDNIKLVFLGEGEEKKIMWNFIKDNNLSGNVSFFRAKRDVKKYLKKAKILVLSSKHEALPLTILEAMALGVPVLCTNYPGVEEVIREGETGFIYRNLDEFKEKAVLLLDNLSVKKKISCQAREYVKKNHSPRNIRQYLDALGLD